MDATLSSTTHHLALLSHSCPLLYLYLPFLRSVIDVMKGQTQRPFLTYFQLTWGRIERYLDGGINSTHLESDQDATGDHAARWKSSRNLKTFRSASGERMSALLTLPTELQLYIVSFLPPDAILALRLSNAYFYCTVSQKLPSPSDSSLTSCQRFAIRRHLEYYAQPSSSNQGGGGKGSRSNSSSSSSSSSDSGASGEVRMTRCLLCKSTYPAYMFSSNHSPACLPQLGRAAAGSSHNGEGQSVTGAANGTMSTWHEVLRLPEGICGWHVGRLGRLVLLPDRQAGNAFLGGPPKQPGWYATTEKMCTHCGSVWWRERTRGEDSHGTVGLAEPASVTGSSTQRCECTCETCQPILAQAFTRYLSQEEEKSGACRTWKFWRDESTNELFVRENMGLNRRADDHAAEQKDIQVIPLD